MYRCIGIAPWFGYYVAILSLITCFSINSSSIYPTANSIISLDVALHYRIFEHPEKLEYLRKYLGDDNLSLTTQESFSSLDSDMSIGSVSPKRPTKERPSFSSPRTQKIRASSLNNSEDVSIGSFTPSPPTSAKRANISPKGNSR